MSEPIRVVVFSGSDSSGCAGLQADLRTFQRLGVHGLSVVTAVTAQTASQVSALEATSLALIRAQFRAARETGFEAGKTGLLSGAEMISAVADLWEPLLPKPLVVDPVLASSSGQVFLAGPSREALIQRLIPLASVLTPNLPEAEWLVGRPLAGAQAREEAAHEIQSWGVDTVVIKGGHEEDRGEVRDLVLDSRSCHWLSGPRLETANSRGTGCVLASAIASFLACGDEGLQAVTRAREVVQKALSRGYSLNGGPGPCGQLGS